MVNALDGVHPELKTKIFAVLQAMEILGFPMLVFEGVRTAKRQNELYQQGRTKPGRKVTNCDGYKIIGPHQLRADNYGHAVDCVFIDGGKPSWDDEFPWTLYGEAVKSQGLKWGGDFQSLKGDFAHAELNDGRKDFGEFSE